jgi:hypothetical protein
LQNPAQGQYFGTIHSLDTGSTASYNALLLSVQKRLSSHFTALANYTWSHCVSGPFTSELDGTQYTNPANRRFDRGNCTGIDRRHIFNFSAVEESPKFSERWMQWVAGGWQLSEIMRIQSGSFLTIGAGTDQALNGIGGQRASYVGGSTSTTATGCSLVPTCVPWLNFSAFAVPALGTFGNLGPSNIVGPGSFQFDISLVRQFAIREHQRLEIRGEAFNLPNHTRPNNPATGLNSPTTFGQITSFADPRIMQFAFKYYF